MTASDTKDTDLMLGVNGKSNPVLHQTTTPYGSYLHRTKWSFNRPVTGIVVSEMISPARQSIDKDFPEENSPDDQESSVIIESTSVGPRAPAS